MKREVKLEQIYEKTVVERFVPSVIGKFINNVKEIKMLLDKNNVELAKNKINELLMNAEMHINKEI